MAAVVSATTSAFVKATNKSWQLVCEICYWEFFKLHATTIHRICT